MIKEKWGQITAALSGEHLIKKQQQHLTTRQLKNIQTYLLTQDVIWTSIQRCLNVMDVRWTLKRHCVLNGMPVSFL